MIVTDNKDKIRYCIDVNDVRKILAYSTKKTFIYRCPMWSIEICLICERTYDKSKHIWNHIGFKHYFECFYCKIFFATSALLKGHIIYLHSKVLHLKTGHFNQCIVFILQLTVLRVKYFLAKSTTLVSISKTLMNSLQVLWQIAVDNARMNYTNSTNLESI